MTDDRNKPMGGLTWEESAAVLETNAQEGDARAQRLLAIRYLRGRGVPKDESIAVDWMQLAAQQHFAKAQRGLGELYESGLGVVLDAAIASHWYRLAALQGDPVANDHLQRLAQAHTSHEGDSQSTQQGLP
jgi:TPR repeat protein